MAMKPEKVRRFVTYAERNGLSVHGELVDGEEFSGGVLEVAKAAVRLEAVPGINYWVRYTDVLRIGYCLPTTLEATT